jgi:arginyl-tRNA synthetase
MTRSPDTTGNAVARLAERLSKLAGAPVALERPRDPAHGDYATNVALRTAPQHKRPPRELAADLAVRGPSSTRRAGRGRGAGIPQP